MNSEFYVFGKVTKLISSTSDDTINLLEKTTFRSLGEEFIKKFTDIFSELPDEIMAIPEVRTKIKGPAIQVLPIAIFI